MDVSVETTVKRQFEIVMLIYGAIVVEVAIPRNLFHFYLQFYSAVGDNIYN